MSDKSLLFSKVVLVISFISFFFALDNLFLDSVVCAFYEFIGSLSPIGLIQIIVVTVALLLIFLTNKSKLWISYPDVYLCVNIFSILAIILILILNFEYILTILEIIIEHIIKIFGGGTGSSRGGASGTGHTGPSKKPNPNPKGNDIHRVVNKENQRKLKKMTHSKSATKKVRSKHIEDFQEYYDAMVKKDLNSQDIAEIQRKTKKMEDLRYKWETVDADRFSQYPWYKQFCIDWAKEHKK